MSMTRFLFCLTFFICSSLIQAQRVEAVMAGPGPDRYFPVVGDNNGYGFGGNIYLNTTMITIEGKDPC